MADKTYSGQKGNDKLVISGKRRDVVFPPSVVDLQAEDDRRISVHTSKTEGENNLPFRQEEFPSTIESSRNGGMEFDECSLLSMDRLSLPSNQECLQDACLAISCCDSELDINTLACCLYYHPPSPMDKKFEATPIETPYQQALDAHKSSLSRPHIQEQDTSPHESLEQGNSTCVATSTSICEKQVEYRREENYKFPEMVDYEKRLKNFEKYQWPLSSPSPEKLAEAGMFYEGKTYNCLQPCCKIDKHQNMISS